MRPQEDERLTIARELATICGKPPRLCVQALGLFQNNRDAAFNWLMDFGTAFLPSLSVGEPPAGSYTGFGAGAAGGVPRGSSLLLRAAYAVAASPPPPSSAVAPTYLLPASALLHNSGLRASCLMQSRFSPPLVCCHSHVFAACFCTLA